MKSIVVLALAVCMGLGHATVASSQSPPPELPCTIASLPPLPPNTGIALGPTMYQILVANPQLASVLLASRDAWDATDAANRLGDWNGIVTNSDCPSGQPMQIGAFNFFFGNCPAVTQRGNQFAVAFVDTPVCAGCGTRSMSLNLHHMWSFNPGPDEFDVQSVMTHEFGHMLGLNHMTNGDCGPNISTCGGIANLETMTARISPGETCYRSLSPNDVASANDAY